MSPHVQTVQPGRTLTVPARFDQLQRVLEFVADFAMAANFGDTEVYDIQVAMDEACANIIEHAYGGEDRGNIEVSCRLEDDRLVTTLKDTGKPFDPEDVPEPELDGRLEDRQTGGLGLHFMRNLMDEVNFRFEDDGNYLTFVKVRKVKTVLDEEDEAIGVLWNRLVPLVEPLAYKDTIDAQIEIIRSAASKVVEGDASIWLSPTITNYLEHYPEPSEPSEPTKQAYEGQQVIVADEGRRVAFPLSGHDSRLGVLEVSREKGCKPFSSVEKVLLRGLGSLATLSLQSARQLAVERWRVQQLHLVRQVSSQLTIGLTLDELFQRITDLIIHRFNYYYATLYTFEGKGEGRSLKFRASSGPLGADGAPPEHPTRLNPKLGRGIVGWVAENGQEIIANDVSQEPRYKHYMLLPETRAEVAFPLIFEGEIVGVLDVQSDETGDFEETDVLVLRALADQAAIAIEESRLYHSLKRRAEQLVTVGEVSRAITSILNTDELLREVVMLMNGLGYPSVQIFTFQPARKLLVLQASSDYVEHDRSPDITLSTSDTDFVITQAASLKMPVLVGDVLSQDEFSPTPGMLIEPHSELAIPLLFAENLLGVMNIQSERPYAFDDDDLSLLETLGRTVAIALRNAELYRSELWRRQVTDSLREVAGLLSTRRDLDSVLKEILHKLALTLPCDVAAIWMLVQEEGREDYGGGKGGSKYRGNRLRLAAVHSFKPLADGNLELPVCENDWLENVLRDTAPRVRVGGDAMCPLAARLGLPEDHSGIGTQLNLHGRTLGLITMAHRQPQRYGRESRSMVTAFASQTSIAIENANRYEQAKEHERLERELELAREVQAGLLPDELPTTEGWQLAATWHPARRVSGDYYDVLKLPHGQIGLVMADVADKGMPAALFMALTRATLRAIAYEGRTPAGTLQQVNNLLLPDAQHGMFVTAFYCEIDPLTGFLTHASAGHVPPLIFHSDVNEVEWLRSRDIALGVMPKAAYHEGVTSMRPGDFLVLYTDGISETFSPEEEQFGYRRLADVIRSAKVSSPEDVLDAITAAINDFSGDSSLPADDRAILVAHRLPNNV